MALPLALLILGLAGVYLFGFRGLRAGASPHCRKCGYDLAGIETPTICPECGSDLDRDLAVRRGGLRKKPVIALVFSVVLLLGATLVGYRLFLTTTNMPMAQRPVWLLKLDAKSSVEARADEAIAELGLRRIAGKFDLEAYASYADLALDRHAELDEQWMISPWQDVLITAHANGLLTEAQKDRAIRQQFRPDVFQPWKADQRALQPYDVFAGGFTPKDTFRAALPGEFLLVANPTNVTKDGEPYPLAPEPMYGDRYRVFVTSVTIDRDLNGRGASMSHGGVSIPKRYNILRYDDLSAGRHVFDVEYELEIRRGSAFGPDADWEKDPLLVLPMRAQRTVHIIEDPSDVLEYVGSSTNIPRPLMDIVKNSRNSDRAFVVAPGYSQDQLQVSLQISRASQPGDAAYVAHACYLEIEGERLPLRQSEHSKNTIKVPFAPSDSVESRTQTSSRGFFAFFHEDELPRVESATLILVPDPEYAVVHTDADIFWNDEIILEDVPLDWSRVPEPTRNDEDGTE